MATVIEVIETKWDDADEKSSNLYETIIEADKSLPSSMATLLKNLRKKLNFKLCQAFM